MMMIPVALNWSPNYADTRKVKFFVNPRNAFM